MNLYEILGVGESASPEQIKQAFKARAQLFHPDKVKGDARMFSRIRLAYKVLSNPTSRKHYDDTGEAKDMLPEETRARQKITTIIAGLLQDSEVDLDKLDLVESIKATLNADWKIAHDGAMEALMQKGKVERMIGKLGCDSEGDDQLIKGPMEDTLAQIDRYLLKTGMDKKTIDVALGIMTHHNQCKPMMLGGPASLFTSCATSAATSW